MTDNPSDHALAAALLILELLDASPGLPKYELLSRVASIVGHAIRRSNAESVHVPGPSRN